MCCCLSVSLNSVSEKTVVMKDQELLWNPRGEKNKTKKPLKTSHVAFFNLLTFSVSRSLFCISCSLWWTPLAFLFKTTFQFVSILPTYGVIAARLCAFGKRVRLSINWLKTFILHNDWESVVSSSGGTAGGPRSCLKGRNQRFLAHNCH